jgi:hypothetical protein
MKMAKYSADELSGGSFGLWRSGEPAVGAAAKQAVAGYGVYQRHRQAPAIESPEDFLVGGIARIVNDAAQSFSFRGDGIPLLVNAAIQVVEESYVAFPADDCVDPYLEKVADCAIAFVKADSVKEEHAAVLRLGNALDELGAAVNIFFGEIAQTANLKLRVLSRLLLVNSMRPILDNSNKNAEIDFQRLSRINLHRQRSAVRFE